MLFQHMFSYQRCQSNGTGCQHRMSKNLLEQVGPLLAHPLKSLSHISVRDSLSGDTRMALQATSHHKQD